MVMSFSPMVRWEKNHLGAESNQDFHLGGHVKFDFPVKDLCEDIDADIL